MDIRGRKSIVDVLLHNGHDTDWFTRYLPTIRSPDRLSRPARHPYTNSESASHTNDHLGIPFPTRIGPTVETTMQEDRSSVNAGILLQSSIDPTLATVVQKQDDSSANAGILLATRIWPTLMTRVQDQDHIPINADIPFPTRIEQW
ncbi:hypothetical protein L873DRAFT_1048894 [Choiromyces venosus 120613-1]|uniref:Uncharacterized protein n=1 Tax=Choiromyces venosus 120613-1 TaxID=1336337 RepID=A0A3N4JJ58_9PEZI|nr:hypothetical protein L873DRAFT_1048894 [Choiromyces venosus 120613-1]